MQKMIWTRPGMNAVAFEANDYIASSCSAKFGGTLYCGLPGNPTSWEGNGSCGHGSTYHNSGMNAFPGDRGYHGTCHDGTSVTVEGSIGSNANQDIWDVQLGSQVSSDNIHGGFTWGYYTENDAIPEGETSRVESIIGSFDLSAVVSGWFQVSWLSAPKNNDGLGWVRHLGLMNITSVERDGSQNRS